MGLFSSGERGGGMGVPFSDPFCEWGYGNALEQIHGAHSGALRSRVDRAQRSD